MDADVQGIKRDDAAGRIMLASRLAAKVCQISVHVDALPTTEEALGHEVLMAHLGDLGLKLDGNTFAVSEASSSFH